MAVKHTPAINYLDRDFSTIKESLVDYAKRYFPTTFKDFNEASFGALMLDAVAYVGDVLSFYLDYQTNESFLDTAVEYENIIRLARQMGYDYRSSPSSTGVVTLFVKIPRDTSTGGPNANYLPVLKRGTSMASSDGNRFMLIEDVNFGDEKNEMVVAEVDGSTGEPTSYAVRAYGTVVSGYTTTEIVDVGPYTPLMKIQLETPYVTEILNIVDSEGHPYYEVPNLAQDTIFMKVRNRNDLSQAAPKYVLKPYSVPRRFTVEQLEEDTFIQFGYGSDSALKNIPLAKVNNVVLKQDGKDYITNTTFDPGQLNETDKLGVSPSNTFLQVTVRANNSDNVNASAGSLNTVSNALWEYPSLSDTTPSIRQSIGASLEAFNEKPIIGDTEVISAAELKVRAASTYTAQNRAVTKGDYEAIAYRMPQAFGSIAHCSAQKDQDSIRRNLNLYVACQDDLGTLIAPNAVIKSNLKSWIENYKMINDTIDIKDARIVNYAIEFVAFGDTRFSKFNIMENIRSSLAEYFLLTNMSIGEPLVITDLYKQINQSKGVIDCTRIRLVPRVGTGYSSATFDFDRFTSADGRKMMCPPESVLELKYVTDDIIGTIR